MANQPDKKENKNATRVLIEASQQGQKTAPVSLVTQNPTLASVLSKLVTPEIPSTVNHQGNREISNINLGMMRDASQQIGQKIDDADMVLELFPEMGLIKQIMVTMILAPKDMYQTELNFSAPTELLVTPIAPQLIEVVKKHFTINYPLEEKLYRILEDVLFSTGSWVEAVIPENSIDEQINGSTEITRESLSSFFDKDMSTKVVGWLGNSDHSPNAGKSVSQESISLESLFNPILNTPRVVDNTVKRSHENQTISFEGLTFTDDFTVLKVPKLLETLRTQRGDALMAQQSKGPAFEHFHSYSSENGVKTMSDSEVARLFYKNKTTRHIGQIKKIKTDSELSRSMVGEPLLQKLPSEAVIPVYTPGNEEKHVGYFVLLDAEGHPLTRQSSQYDESDLRSRLSGGTTNSLSSYLMKKASAKSDNCDANTFLDVARVYADIIEAEILSRLKNGIVGPGVTIARNEEVFRIMLARQLKKERVQALYMPLDLVTYFAYNYNDFGIGVSLLEQQKVLNSIRSALLFAKTMGQIKNAIGRTNATLKIPENDPNPYKTAEMMVHSIMGTRATASTFPLGTNNASDLMQWIGKAGMQINYNGVPGLPEVGVDFTESSSDYREPNNELLEELKKNSIMGLGLPPEIIDAANGPEFARAVTANNVLLSKRVQRIQEKFEPLISDHCRKVLLNHAPVFAEIKDMITENIDVVIEGNNESEFVQQLKDNKPLLSHMLTLEFLSKFEAGLARPDTVAIDNQLDALSKQNDLIDKVLDAVFVEQAYDAYNLGENATEILSNLKAVFKAHYMREWLQENNVLTNILADFTTDEDGSMISDIPEQNQRYSDGLAKMIVRMMNKLKPVTDAADRDLDKISGGEDLGGGGAVSDNSDDGGGGDDASGGDMGGDFDMDFGGGDDPFAEGDSTETTEESSTSTTTDADGNVTSSSSSSSSSSGGF